MNAPDGGITSAAFFVATVLTVATVIPGFENILLASAIAQTYPCSNPTKTGTEGSDVLVGTGGNDVISGKGGNDVITGLGGNDIICGGSGNDVINGGNGQNEIYGDGGDDWIIATDPSVVSQTGAGPIACPSVGGFGAGQECFSTTFDIGLFTPGHWRFVIEFYNAQDEIIAIEGIDYRVHSFFVVPESPIGILALVVSSLAVLGGFMFLKKRSQSTMPI